MAPEQIRSAVAQPALVAAALALALSYVLPHQALQILRLLLGVYVFAALLSAALTAYHKWNFQAVAPADRHFALVTGATSGLGKEIALQLAAKKYSLVLASRTEANLARLAAEIKESFAIEAIYCACDLSTAEGAKQLEQFVKERELVVDVLVNNAGSTVTGDVLQLDEGDVDRIMALDMAATARLTRALVPAMVARGVGHVLNISSITASLVIPSSALYSASKAFVMHFSEAVDYELRSTGVSVTCYCPGPLHTNFGKASNSEDSIYFHAGLATPVKESASGALRAMFAGESLAYDSWSAYLSTTLASIAPRRAAAATCAVGQNEPCQVWNMLKR